MATNATDKTHEQIHKSALLWKAILGRNLLRYGGGVDLQQPWVASIQQSRKYRQLDNFSDDYRREVLRLMIRGREITVSPSVGDMSRQVFLTVRLSKVKYFTTRIGVMLCRQLEERLRARRSLRGRKKKEAAK